MLRSNILYFVFWGCPSNSTLPTYSSRKSPRCLFGAHSVVHAGCCPAVPGLTAFHWFSFSLPGLALFFLQVVHCIWLRSPFDSRYCRTCILHTQRVAVSVERLFSPPQELFPLLRSFRGTAHLLPSVSRKDCWVVQQSVLFAAHSRGGKLSENFWANDHTDFPPGRLVWYSNSDWTIERHASPRSHVWDA